MNNADAQDMLTYVDYWDRIGKLEFRPAQRGATQTARRPRSGPVMGTVALDSWQSEEWCASAREPLE